MKDTVVRVVLLLVVAVAIMAWVGWIRFDRSADRATIEINTSEIERAADKAVQAGRNMAADTSESIHEATEPTAPAPPTAPIQRP
jgi:hypothetical protein